MASFSSTTHSSPKPRELDCRSRIDDEVPFHLQPKKPKLSAKFPGIYSRIFGSAKSVEQSFLPPDSDAFPDISLVVEPSHEPIRKFFKSHYSTEDSPAYLGKDDYRNLLERARAEMDSRSAKKESLDQLKTDSMANSTVASAMIITAPPTKTLTVASPAAEDWCSRVSNTTYLSKQWLSNLTSSPCTKMRKKERGQLEMAVKYWATQRRLSERAKIDELEQRLACLLRTPIILNDPYLKPQHIPQELPFQRPKRSSLPVLSEEQFDFVLKTLQAASQPDTILVNNFRLAVTQREILTLANTNWLSDMVINFYLQLIFHRSKRLHENSAVGPRVAVMNTFFYPKLTSGGGYAGVRRWTRSLNLFDHDLVLIPVHDRGIHWCLAVVDFRKKTLSYYDSMGGENNRCLDSLLVYLDSESCDKRQLPLEELSAWEKINTSSSVPQQENGCDCGVFLCTFAEFLSRDADFTFSQGDMPDIRKRMMYEILTQQLLTTNTNLAPPC